MRLVVAQPSGRLVIDHLVEIVAEGPLGRFGLLPRHVDFASTLVPSIIRCVDEDGKESFLAIDGGILVKRGPDVDICARIVVEGSRAEGIADAVAARLASLAEDEREERAAVARLEAEFMRRFDEVLR